MSQAIKPGCTEEVKIDMEERQWRWARTAAKGTQLLK
jgi:hypothetical protein